MNCRQLETLVGAYADGELDALRNYSIRKHLLSCAGCTTTHHSILALHTRIRAEVPKSVAPPALHARVRAMADAVRASAPARARPRDDRWRWLTGGVLAGCTASVFAWMLGTTVLAWRAHDDFAVAAVTTHVRATLGDHLIEVTSSDRHTVKPWLSARLDYLERHAVATLVYRYRQHTIDVFVRPEVSHAPMSALRTVRGFNVVRASGPTMDWLAVSDAEPAVLSAFVQRLAREDVSQ